MELSAIFETWHLGDGNYPALEYGMLVNLSFEIVPVALDRPGPLSFKHLGDAEYEFSGVILRVYQGEGDPPDLFYPLRVVGIRKVKLPDHFISRSAHCVSYPTRITPAEYGPDDVSAVDAIDDEEWCHYIVRFSDQDLPDVPIARTFL